MAQLQKEIAQALTAEHIELLFERLSFVSQMYCDSICKEPFGSGGRKRRRGEEIHHTVGCQKNREALSILETLYDNA